MKAQYYSLIKKCLFITLVFGALVLIGCGAPTTQNIFTYVLSTEPDSIDPSIWFTTSPLNLNVYQTLLEVNQPGSEKPFTPMLAESYTVSDDGLTWNFKLRKGVKFSDGAPFNAEAVKFSVERTLAIKESPAGIWSAVEAINVVNDLEVQFKLNAPVPFDYIVAGGYGTFMMSPKAVNEHEKDGDLAKAWMKDNAAGTGPYKVKEWVRGERMVLEKVRDYWGGWPAKYPETIVVKFVTEYSTARLMLEKGEADMVDFIPADQVEDAKKLPGVTVETYPSYETLYFHFNAKKAPTDNVLVRQALSYAFNYDAIADISKGQAQQMAGVLPSTLWGFKQGLFKYSFDPEKAKSMLAQAGYPKGFKITMGYAAQDELQRQLAEMYKSDLSKIGVTLDLEAAPWATIKSKQQDLKTAYNVFSRYWWPDYVDPQDFVLYLLHSGQSSNFSYYANPVVDELIDNAHAIAGKDHQKAVEMYEKLQDIVVEEAQSVFVLEKNWLVPRRTWVKNYLYNPAYPRIVKFYGLTIEK